MRNVVLVLLVAAGAAAVAIAARSPANAANEGTEEVRVFILDKAGNPVDVKNWTGAIEVTPENGTKKTTKLELVPASKMEGLKEGAKEGAKDLRDEAKEKYSGAKGEEPQAPGAQDDKARMHQKDMKLCGQLQKMDDGYVEMVVARPGGMKHAKEGAHQGSDMGFKHDHGASYFKANLDKAWIQNPKTGAVNFDATVVFTTPNGDTKYVKGFEYPSGMINGAITQLVDKDFGDTSNWDHERAAMVSHKVQATLAALPELSFKGDGDRKEYEKARQDCMEKCRQLEQATGKNIADAADKCKSALKEVRSQAKDSQGALSAD
jgi:hypothetical protein